MRLVSLAVTLFGFWLLLSGHYTGFLFTVGIASSVFCVWVSERMRVVDVEGHPISLTLGAVTYWPWLVWEIAKSTWAVIRVVLSFPLAIAPNLITVKASQKTQVGVATYGNSITLTPGTITVDVEGEELTIHALTQATADDLLEGTMDRRVCSMEGSA